MIIHIAVVILSAAVNIIQHIPLVHVVVIHNVDVSMWQLDELLLALVIINVAVNTLLRK